MKQILIILFHLFAIVALNAQPALPAIFSDNMVLQQNTKVAIWGKSQPNAEVELLGSWMNEKIRTTADATGNFMFWVETKSALPIESRHFDVRDKTGSVTFNNVVFGEVWLAGGQSNMAWQLDQTTRGDDYIRESRNENIRFYHTPHYYFEGDRIREKGEWVEASPETMPRLSAVAYHFAKNLQKSLNVPVGVILCYKGGTPAESWMSQESLEKHGFWDAIFERYSGRVKSTYEKDYQQFLIDNRAYQNAVRRGETPATRRPSEPMGWRHPQRPVGMYEFMLKPLMPFTVKGFLWYQGEADATRAQQYERLFPQLIADWRSDFKIPNAPFLFVQLTGYHHPVHPEYAWGNLRYAQWKTAQTVPNTAMVVITDIGDKKDIHPMEKQPVGYRLYLAALAKAYDQKVIFQGPEFRSKTISGNKIILSFDHIASGLKSSDGEPLRDFEIMDANGKFRPAQAKIIGHTIEIWNDKVKQPKHVRYAWKNWVYTNLVNSEGLPAVPFKTN